MWWSYPQVIFAAKRLQQLLVVSVSHLSQECQQTSHKLSLEGQHTHRRKPKVRQVISISTVLHLK